MTWHQWHHVAPNVSSTQFSLGLGRLKSLFVPVSPVNCVGPVGLAHAIDPRLRAAVQSPEGDLDCG